MSDISLIRDGESGSFKLISLMQGKFFMRYKCTSHILKNIHFILAD